jgi:diguanylate cyclase (GGDEF)-like protein
MSMSVRKRILIHMILVSTFVALAILASGIWLFSGYVGEQIDDELDRALQGVLNEINALKRSAYTVSLYFANDPGIAKALAGGDRETLLIRATKMHVATGIELGIITDAFGKVLARTHAPEIYGDDLTTVHIVREALTGKTVNEFGSSVTVDMAAYSAAPIFDESGWFLGTVVVGFRLDTEYFVDKHKKITDCEVTIVRGNERVATTLLQEDGTRAVGTKVPEHIMQTLLRGKPFSGHSYILGQELLARYSPVLDADGTAVGALFVGRFLTKKTNTIWALIKAGLISTITILGIACLSIVLVTQHISAPIKKTLDKVYYDGLTGIYNRRYFDENIERIVQSMSRSGDALSLLMIDVDFFKQYNDTYGHTAGDDCLVAVADTLLKCVTRENDIIARYGGEEFVAILPDTDESGVGVVANRILKGMEERHILHEKSEAAAYVTVSIGSTTVRVSYHHKIADYIKCADKAMYTSKRNGRNRYTHLKFENAPE